MNEDQADEILYLMSQVWFKTGNMADGTIKIWTSAVGHLDYESTKDAVMELAGVHAYWPAISEFRKHYSSIIRRNQMSVPAIEREYLPREENVRRLKELRENL